MATTTITKKYVQDRIAARIATLDRVIEKGTEAEAELTKLRVTPLRDWVATTKERVQMLSELLDINVNKIKDAEMLRYVQGVNNYIPSAYSRWGQTYSGEARRLEEVIQAGTEAGVEKIKLQHAEAYLQEMPADEFSITALKTLGLMEAIKFRLEPEAKK
jgi:hypothetical protein